MDLKEFGEMQMDQVLQLQERKNYYKNRLGNLNAKAIGVISSPEIFTHQLNIEDKFIVLGSDGLWDVMSSEEVCEFIRKSE